MRQIDAARNGDPSEEQEDCYGRSRGGSPDRADLLRSEGSSKTKGGIEIVAISILVAVALELNKQYKLDEKAVKLAERQLKKAKARRKKSKAKKAKADAKIKKARAKKKGGKKKK